MRVEIVIEFDLDPVVEWVQRAVADVGREIERVLSGDPHADQGADQEFNQYGELVAPFDPMRSDN